MAGKNEVTITFAGDTQKLTKAFDDVGSAAKGMDGEVRGAGEGFDNLGERADVGEARILGVKDSVDGFTTVLKGPAQQGMAAYIQGWADLASGVANFIVPAAKAILLTGRQRVISLASAAATRVATAAQWALNVAMRANPIGIVITALTLLVGAFVIAYRRSQTFRNIVNGALRAVANVGQAVFGWFRRNWPLLLGVLTGPIGLAVVAIIRYRDRILGAFRAIPGVLRSVFGGIGRAITGAFRGAINTIISGWNRLQFTLPSVSVFGQKIGGFTIGTPDIPYLHRGGIVPGPPGADVLAILQAGETVTPAGASGRAVIEIRSAGTALDDALVQVLAKAIKRRAGGHPNSVQLVLGRA